MENPIYYIGNKILKEKQRVFNMSLNPQKSTAMGRGGQGFAVAFLRAGVGARALAKSLEVSEFKFV